MYESFVKEEKVELRVEVGLHIRHIAVGVGLSSIGSSEPDITVGKIFA